VLPYVLVRLYPMTFQSLSLTSWVPVASWATWVAELSRKVGFPTALMPRLRIFSPEASVEESLSIVNSYPELPVLIHMVIVKLVFNIRSLIVIYSDPKN